MVAPAVVRFPCANSRAERTSAPEARKSIAAVVNTTPSKLKLRV